MFGDGRDRESLPSSEDLFAGIPRSSASEIMAAPLAAVSQALGLRRKHVKSFEDASAAYGTLSSYPLGLRTVEVRRIVGSVGRAAELGPDFLPLEARRKTTPRLKRIVRAMENGVELPPLDLYKLKTEYYVLDGNHRVAAARRLGQLYLDAIVTEFIPVRDTHYTDVFMGRQRFEKATGLTSVAATSRERFRTINRIVQAYYEEKRAQGELRNSFKEAAQVWYNSLYVPISDAIRHTKLPSAFPDLRSGDFFVYIFDYMEREKGRGRELDWRQALDELATYYTGRQRRLPRLLHRRTRQGGPRPRKRRDTAPPEDPLGILPPMPTDDGQAQNARTIPFLPGEAGRHERASLLHRPTDLYTPVEEGASNREEPTTPPTPIL